MIKICSSVRWPLVQLLHTEQDVRIAFERDLRTENDHKWDALRKVNEDYQTGLKEIVQVCFLARFA